MGIRQARRVAFWVVAILTAALSTAALAQGGCLNSNVSQSQVCINNIEVSFPPVPAGQAPSVTLNVHFFGISGSGDASNANEPDFFQVRFSHTAVGSGMIFVRQDKVTGKSWSHGWLITEPWVPGAEGPPYFFQVQDCFNTSPGFGAVCNVWANLTYSPPGQGAPPQQSTQQASASMPTPGSCKQGFVWRQVDPRDHVCVTAQERQQIDDENAAAAQHTVSRGAVRVATPQACLNGYVWRQAVPSDYVCVTPQARAAVQGDNAAAPSRTN
jgi:hypothetical protein